MDSIESIDVVSTLVVSLKVSDWLPTPEIDCHFIVKSYIGNRLTVFVK